MHTRSVALAIVLVVLAFGAWGQRVPPLPAQIIEVTAGDVNGLIEAITVANQSDGLTEIVVLPDRTGARPAFLFGRPLVDGPNALPVVTGQVRITTGRLARDAVVEMAMADTDSRFRLAEVAENGELVIIRGAFRDFIHDGAGGLFSVGRLGRLVLDQCDVSAVTAVENGGVINATGNAVVELSRCRFTSNASSQGLGGVIASTGSALLDVRDSLFEANAAADGCAIFHASIAANRLRDSVVRNVTFAGGCRDTLVVNDAGTMALVGNTFINVNTAIAGAGTFRLFGNAFGPPGDFAKGLAKDSCEVDGEVLSDGHNISVDDTCGLDNETDLPNSDPGLEEPDAEGVVKLKDTSLAIDAGAEEISSAITANLGVTLPCGYKDVRDLGRPQDANGDGSFECDIGDYEVQGGDDIGAAQSGAFFDVARSGEGVFLEMLPGGSAFVAMFTYDTDKTGLAWFVGTGAVMGNSVVVDEFLGTTGGVFGEAFDADAIEKFTVAGMSLVFPTCEGTSSPGKMAFQADEEVEYDDLLVDLTRLTSIVSCDGTAHANAGLSGSFFAPERDGEGIFVQWLPGGNVVVIWYTYDADGNQFWTISDTVMVADNRVTAQMVYPAQVTAFGDAFDSGEIVLQPWGTLTLDYTDCDNMTFSYDSTVEGFGAGSHAYVRLTTLDGTECSL